MFKREKVYQATDVDNELEQFHNGNITKQELMVFLNEERLTLREPADNIEKILQEFCANLSCHDDVNVNIKYITLRYWSPDQCFIEFIKCIAFYCESLSILKIIDCGLESIHIIQISKYFNNNIDCQCELSHIDLSRNDIDSKGIINGLSSMIEYHCDTLQHFYMNCNNIASKGLISLSKSLSVCNNIVSIDIVGQYFDINNNNDDDDEEINDASCLISALINKKHLKTLCLDCNKIVGDETKQKKPRDLFPLLITSCDKLSCLTMGGCGLTLMDYKLLFEGFIERGINYFKPYKQLSINLPKGIWLIICDYFIEYIDIEKVRLFLFANDMNTEIYNLICDVFKNPYFSVDELDIHGSLNNILKWEEIAKIGNILKEYGCRNRIRQITFDCGGYIDGRSLGNDWLDKLQDEAYPMYYTRGNPGGTRGCYKRSNTYNQYNVANIQSI